jgi:hypothetical protein
MPRFLGVYAKMAGTAGPLRESGFPQFQTLWAVSSRHFGQASSKSLRSFTCRSQRCASSL